ncbi:type IV pilin N-terminal domain-containing protein [Natrinema zhouii]|uniref:Type IV pilin N-terminal domain-containing protein n=1 Tax=Natrinema zhouii TaxID=1710539 RepID=A0A7D6GJB9_9EURY|nr:type IV pilin N-terminal domain-containing protein [Natrinema zhouii]QLK25139.1 type IV pilin N-terminal domain-containing protein [Natrinema zhouii]
MDLKQYRSKLIGNKDERAVSPVIGVILMVAITVILAAVIAAFVLDLGQGMDEEAQAGIDIEGDESSEVSVQLTSLGNADGIYITKSDGTKLTESETASGGSGTVDLTDVGASVTLTSGNAGADSYSVVAYIGDNADSTDTTTVVNSFEVTT